MHESTHHGVRPLDWTRNGAPAGGTRLRLILCARREERLRELAAELPVPCRIIAADVSDEQECRLLYEAVQSEELEVVINNAGFGLVRRVCHRRSG